MPRIPIAARNIRALERHFGPVRAIAGLPMHLAALTLRPRAVWFGTRLPWRLTQSMLPERLRKLVPYVEPHPLHRHGFEFVRAGWMRGNRSRPGIPRPASGVADGTSNTLLLSEGPEAGRRGSTGIARGTNIADGTSNTLLLSEGAAAGRPGSTGTAGGTGIADGTSNTLLLSEGPAAGRRGDTGTAGGAGIADGTSNTIAISETPGPGRGDILTGDVPFEEPGGGQIADGTIDTLLLEESPGTGGGDRGPGTGPPAGRGPHGGGGPPGHAGPGASGSRRPR